MDELDEGIGSNDSSANSSETAINNLKSLKSEHVVVSNKLQGNTGEVTTNHKHHDNELAVNNGIEENKKESETNGPIMISEPNTNGSLSDTNTVDEAPDTILAKTISNSNESADIDAEKHTETNSNTEEQPETTLPEQTKPEGDKDTKNNIDIDDNDDDGECSELNPELNDNEDTGTNSNLGLNDKNNDVESVKLVQELNDGNSNEAHNKQSDALLVSSEGTDSSKDSELPDSKKGRSTPSFHIEGVRKSLKGLVAKVKSGKTRVVSTDESEACCSSTGLF